MAVNLHFPKRAMARVSARVTGRIADPAQRGTPLGFYAVAVVAILVPLGLDAITGNALTTTRALSADALWTLGFLQDIFVHGGHLADWNFGHHTDFFPDKLFAAAAYAISSRPDRWLLVFEALNLALYFGIAWYCLWLCLRATGDAAAARRIALWGALLVTGLPPLFRSWGLFDIYLRYIGIPSNHFGQFFCAILAAFLAIDCFPRPLDRRTIGRLGAACALMMLCALSDKLTIIVAIPGLTVATLYFLAVRRSLSPSPLLCCASLCAVAAGAYFAGDPLWNQVAGVYPAEPGFDPRWTKRLVQPLFQSLLTRSGGSQDPEASGNLVPPLNPWDGTAYVLAHLDPVQVVIFGVVCLAAFSLAIVYARRAALGLLRSGTASPTQAGATAADTFVVYLVASAVLIPLALIAAGVLTERYAFPAGYCILWALTAKLCERVPPALPRSSLALGMAATGLLLCAMPVDASAPPFKRLAKPPLVKCLEEFGQTRDLRRGLGSHWETYPVEFLSEHRIVVLSALEAAQISHWANNVEWYAPQADGRPFTFVISDPFLHEAELREEIGAPTEVLDCSSLGPGFGVGRILYYAGSAAERLTASIHYQYLELRHENIPQ